MRSPTSLIALFGLLLFTAPIYPAQLQITQLEDIDFGSVLPSAQNVRGDIRFCVVSIPGGPFQITGLGSGPGGAFEMQHEALDHTIAYDVFVQRSKGEQNRQLQPGIPNYVRMARPPRRGECSQPFLKLTIDVDETTLQSAPGGQYRSILQLMVAPE